MLVEFCLIPAEDIGRGRAIGKLAEALIIRRYMQSLSDELEDCSIRHRTASKDKDGAWVVQPHEFIIHCALGWSMKPPSKQPTENGSKVYIRHHETSIIGVQVAEALSHWGQVYCCHGHRCTRPVIDNADDVIALGMGGIRVEPFVLNGPHADTYAQRLEPLGRDLGRCVADYITAMKQPALVGSNTADQQMPRLERKL